MMASRVLLTPNWRHGKALHFADTSLPPISTPIEWGYIGAPESTMIRDAYLLDESIADTCDWLLQINPSLIIISSTPNYLYWRCPPLNVRLILDYIVYLHSLGCKSKTLVVGPHGSSDPLWTLERTGADMVFRGEFDGEAAALVDVASALESPFVASSVNLEAKQAPQRHFRDGRFVQYSSIPGILDYEPHAWGTDVRRSLQKRYSRSGALIEYARGCSYNCAFCLRSGFREKLRFKPLACFIDEVKNLARIGIGYVFFIDEDFWRPKQKYRSVVEILHEHDIGFGFQGRPDAFSIEDIDFLAESGCSYIEFGSETLGEESGKALGKFDDPLGTLEIVRYAQGQIDFVFSNVFDISRPLSSGSLEGRIQQLDNEGNIPSPFIAFPGTRFGDRELFKYRSQGLNVAAWELCEALFLMDSARSGFAEHIWEEISCATSEVEALKQIIRLNDTVFDHTGRADTRFNSTIEPSRSRMAINEV